MDSNQTMSNGHLPQANGHLPQANGHLPQANGHLPQANGHLPQANGHLPQSQTSETMVSVGDHVNKTGSGKKQIKARASWGGQLEFLMTCVSYAVGLGNVWRFPYLCYQNGGGAFLIPYILILLLVGLPFFFLEVSFGQFASLGPITIWKCNPLFKGIGFASITVVTYIVLYFNVIIAWCLYFLFSSMQSTLPWTTCDNLWNTDACHLTGPQPINNSFTSNNQLKTPSEEFFYNHVLGMSPSLDDFGTVRWQLACLLLLVWIIIFMVLIKGVSSLGKVSYFVSIFPYIVLTILLVRGATLDGAVDGITFYIKPDFTRLTDLKVWGDAASQIFYSVGVCLGSLIAMSSYNSFHNNTVRDSLLVPIVNCLTSIYSGFVIFAVLGFMAKEKGVDVANVAADGPGLVFVVYPEGLSTMPIPQLWSVLFFIMMCLIGFGSQFSQAETIMTAFLDEYPQFLRVGKRPIIMRACFCAFGYLITLPMVCNGGFYLFQILDTYSSGYPLLVIAICELFAIMVSYGYERFADDIKMMIGRHPPLYFRLSWCIFGPVVILGTITFKAVLETGTLKVGDYEFPPWAMIIAWLIVAFPLLQIVLFMIGRFLKDGGWAAIKKAASPRPGWGPAKPEHRTGRYINMSSKTSFCRDNMAFINTTSVMMPLSIIHLPGYEESIEPRTTTLVESYHNERL